MTKGAEEALLVEISKAKLCPTENNTIPYEQEVIPVDIQHPSGSGVIPPEDSINRQLYAFLTQQWLAINHGNIYRD